MSHSIKTPSIARGAVLALAVLAVLSTALIPTAGAVSKPDAGSDVSPLSAACGRNGPNYQNQRYNDAPSGGPANIRNGSSTSCPAVGVLMPTDDAVYYCYTSGSGGTWTFLRDLRTGVVGWVLDSLLDGYGSNRRCPF
jgi:hypothetical protein